jgi:predicted nucleic acid-binding protein
MRVVVDTNVLISAAFRDCLPEDVIMFLVARPDFEWIATEKIMYKTWVSGLHS